MLRCWKQQYRTLDDLSAGLLVGQKNKADILSYMDDIEGTLVDIQEVFIGYRLKLYRSERHHPGQLE